MRTVAENRTRIDEIKAHLESAIIARDMKSVEKTLAEFECFMAEMSEDEKKDLALDICRTEGNEYDAMRIKKGDYQA